LFLEGFVVDIIVVVLVVLVVVVMVMEMLRYNIANNKYGEKKVPEHGKIVND